MPDQDPKPMFPMRIEEAQNGGYIVTALDNSHIIGRTFAFTDAHDLMRWLGDTALVDKLGAGDWPENVPDEAHAVKNGDLTFSAIRRRLNDTPRSDRDPRNTP